MGDKKGVETLDSGTYVISSIQAVQSDKHAEKYGRDRTKGAPNTNLIAGLENYCKIKNSELIFFSMQGMDVSEREIHHDFWERDDVHEPYSIRLNDKIMISDILVPPQNVDPATSRDRFVQLEGSLIYAHSKQRLKAVPKSNSKLPRLLMTTGSVTLPNYHEWNNRGDVAKREHTYGAVVVEIINRKLYNVRHLTAQKDGKFIDMAMKYDGNKKPTKANVEALVLGDIHVGDTDPQTRNANYEMIDFFKPKRLFLHDFFNGHSVNPHERENLVTRAQNFSEGRLDLEKELKDCHREICELAKAMGKKEINVVDSNHHFFMERYLEGGKFLEEPWNTKLAFKLGEVMIDGENPVEAGIKMMGKVPGNVNFLPLEHDYKVWGWQLASHGHKGLSGARGSIRSREISHGKSITGHTHSPEILRNTVVVGTSTKLDLDYIKGSASSWMAANAVLYEGGLVQLLPIVLGRWKK